MFQWIINEKWGICFNNCQFESSSCLSETYIDKSLKEYTISLHLTSGVRRL